MQAGEGQGRQPAFQADGPARQPVAGPGQPFGADGGPGAPGGRARRAWPTWWITPYLGGALVVLVVFFALQLTVLHHSASKVAPAVSPPAAAAVTGPLAPQVFPDALFEQLTKDIQSKNEKDFLTLVAPSARPAVQTWWANMQAIGFTTGLIMPASATDQVNLDAKGNGTTTVLAGTHNALDPVSNRRQDEVPLERYQLSLHFSSAKAIGQITAWKPLGNDPWDQAGKLYVRKAANVVVAGPAADSAVVDETLPVAQTAAAYDVGLVNQVHSTDLRQEGFVVFVSSNPSQSNAWFSSTKQPSGWPPATSFGFTAQLPGPGASADTKWKLGNLADDTTGGARVVVAPFEGQAGETSQDETTELVTRFALDILSASDQSLLPGSTAPSVPTWSTEGFGVAFEAAYDGDTNPAPSMYNFKALASAVKALPASYKTGALPTTAQLYGGSDQAQQNWRVVAASLYGYIATHYGMSQLLASAELMWTGEPDPRQNVLKSSSSTTLTFFGKDAIQSGWVAYMASPTDLAPATGPAGV